MDDNAVRLAKSGPKSTVNMRSTAISDFQRLSRILDTCPLCHHEDKPSPESLPTPLSTPVPSEKMHQADSFGTSDNPSSSAAIVGSLLPPEPTPLLLRNLDHVSTCRLILRSGTALTDTLASSGIHCIF